MRAHAFAVAYVAAAVAAFAVLLPAAGTSSSSSSTLASAYSARSAGSTLQGCPRAPRLVDAARSVATFLVPCGHHLRVCYRRRCVVLVRYDSGPFVAGRGIDLNLGAARALDPSVRTCAEWGVRRVTWEPAR